MPRRLKKRRGSFAFSGGGQVWPATHIFSTPAAASFTNAGGELAIFDSFQICLAIQYLFCNIMVNVALFFVLAAF